LALFLFHSSICHGDRVTGVDRWEHNNKMITLLYLDGGSFGVKMNFESGKSDYLILDQAFIKVELPFGIEKLEKKRDGKLYLGEKNFKNKIPFSGSKEVIESMILAISNYLLEAYPELSREQRFEKDEWLKLMYEKLMKLLVEPVAGTDPAR
jgi:hypothetical protein